MAAPATAALQGRHPEHPGAVLALDLGTKMGWALRKPDGGIIYGPADWTPEGHHAPGFRFLRFRHWLTETKNAAGTLDRIWFEDITFVKTAYQMRTFGAFWGVLTSWAIAHGVDCDGINPSTIKKGITGNGKAKKAQVIAAVRAHGFRPENDDVADAIALLLLKTEITE